MGTVWHRVAAGIARRSSSRPRLLLCCWATLVVYCATLALRLLGELQTGDPGIDNSPAHRAQELADTYFRHPRLPNRGTQQKADSVLDASGVIYVEGTEDLLSSSNHVLQDLTNRTAARFPHRVSGYLLLQDKPALAGLFVSADRRASFLCIFNALYVGQDIIDFIMELRQLAAFQKVWLGAAGAGVLTAEVEHSTGSDMGRCNLFVLPMALLTLAWVLSSWRFLVIALINFGASTALAFAGVHLYVTAFAIKLNPLVVALMSSMQVALSVDYSLFLLTRFVDEAGSGCSPIKAVERSLQTSGHTVLGSGATLTVCFAALARFPMSFLATLGAGLATAVASAVLVNLSITPALLLGGTRFFAPGRQRPAEGAGRRWGRRLAEAMTHPLASGAAAMGVAVLLGTLLPLAGQLRLSGDPSQGLPADSLTQQTMDHVLAAAFPKGGWQPYLALFLPDATVAGDGPAGTVFNRTFWEATSAALTRVSSAFPDRGSSSILSPMLTYGVGLLPLDKLGTSQQMGLFQVCHESFDPTKAPWPGVPCRPGDSCCEPGDDCCGRALTSPLVQALLRSLGLNVSRAELLEAAAAVRSVLNETVNLNGTAVRALVVADVTPGSPAGCSFARAARAALAADGGRGMLGGGDVPTVEVIDAVVESTPGIMLVTSVLLLLLLGLLYGSVMIPVRAVVTIGCTLVVSLAVLVAVCQKGMLRALGFIQGDGVFVVLPPISTALVLGLAVDYDVFLIGRIVEMRDRGFGDKEAIAEGALRSGRIITAAGLIMTVAFSGLVISKVPLLNMLGMQLITAVLLDTFLMRAVVTPALMAPLGRLNWLPRRPEAPAELMSAELPFRGVEG